ncbi:MAG: NrtR DNA-binding winged helix domain-containing protein, partial [Cyclobacteriaceae bacterium]
SLYQKKIDDRNFRKKILSTGLLVKQEKKDMNSSRKGAFYYTFDNRKYVKLLKTGFDHFI